MARGGSAISKCAYIPGATCWYFAEFSAILPQALAAALHEDPVVATTALAAAHRSWLAVQQLDKLVSEDPTPDRRALWDDLHWARTPLTHEAALICDQAAWCPKSLDVKQLAWDRWHPRRGHCG